jgi:hypothetical protein
MVPERAGRRILAGPLRRAFGRKPLPYRKEQIMELGAVSVSLAVKDLEASRRFYEKLASFTDVRDLQRRLKAQSVQLQQEADESTTGPDLSARDRRSPRRSSPAWTTHR